MVRRVALGLALSLCACADVHAVTCEREGEARIAIESGPRDSLDLLFVIENGGGLSEEQVALTRELSRLARILVTGDIDGDGVRELRALSSVHVGVVSSDMGTGGFTTATCGNGLGGFMFGDDGLLLGRGRTAIPGCELAYPAVFQFAPALDDPEDFASALSCVATVGTAGCQLEQHLDAMLKSVSPAVAPAWSREGYVPPIFLEGTRGHGDGPNAGFLRPDSVLATVVVAEEDDCSASDVDIFNFAAGSRYASVDVSRRCPFLVEALQPIERYIEGLVGLRRHPHDVVFGVIAGVPVEVQGRDTETILTHPDMQVMVDPLTPTRIRPSCNRGGNIAFPPRRIVSVAAGLEAAGALTTVQSICQDNFAEPIDAILARIAEALGGTDCLADDLEVDDEGRIDCDVLELVPAGMTCDALPGRRRVGEEEREGVARELCAVDQVALTDLSAPGFFYETADTTPEAESDIAEQCGERGRRVRFTTPRIVGSEVWMDCATCRP